MEIVKISSSFRDPNGFVFLKDKVMYRQINTGYGENYDYFMNSGLYKKLLESNLIVKHEEVSSEHAVSKNAYKVIKPEIINFISYPYEWSFSQLKDAALVTLKIQRIALDHEMSLKDCSAYNIQYKDNKPILIDTLSFEKYEKLGTWASQYHQFCRHFVAPLCLMAYRNIYLNKLALTYLDGIPIDLASSLLPFKTYFKYIPLYHLHINSKVQKQFADKPKEWIKHRKSNKQNLLKTLEKLESNIKKMGLKTEQTIWADYYKDTNYSEASFNHKKDLVKSFLGKIKSKTILDLGANTGIFSKIASSMGIETISVDNDPNAVEKNYLKCIKDGETKILPLLIDLVNPSPSIGWGNKERPSFFERTQVDAILALALVHHLVISNNIPLTKLSKFFSKTCNFLIIEFIPKSDSQVKRILSNKKDIFPDYTQERFEDVFKKNFSILYQQEIKGSERVLYLMKKIH